MKKTMIIAAAMVAVVSLSGCSDSDEAGGSSGVKAVSASQDPSAKYLEKVVMLTAFPDLEKTVYRKAIKSILDKCRSEGASSEMTDMAVGATVNQLPSTFKELKDLPSDQQKQVLESMVRDMQL